MMNFIALLTVMTA